jgi:hypothetical protein
MRLPTGILCEAAIRQSMRIALLLYFFTSLLLYFFTTLPQAPCLCWQVCLGLYPHELHELHEKSPSLSPSRARALSHGCLTCRWWRCGRARRKGNVLEKCGAGSCLFYFGYLLAIQGSRIIVCVCVFLSLSLCARVRVRVCA